MILSCSEEINNMSYAWRKLRELLGDDVDRKVNRMCFLKGKMVRFFVCLLLSSSGCSLFSRISPVPCFVDKDMTGRRVGLSLFY